MTTIYSKASEFNNVVMSAAMDNPPMWITVGGNNEPVNAIEAQIAYMRRKWEEQDLQRHWNKLVVPVPVTPSTVTMPCEQYDRMATLINQIAAAMGLQSAAPDSVRATTAQDKLQEILKEAKQKILDSRSKASASGSMTSRDTIQQPVTQSTPAAPQIADAAPAWAKNLGKTFERLPNGMSRAPMLNLDEEVKVEFDSRPGGARFKYPLRRRR